VSTPTLIATPEPRGGYTARHIHYGEAPATLVPLLRRIWIHTFDRNTDAMAAALLARDWSDRTVNPRPRRGHPRPVPGVGWPAPHIEPAPHAGSLTEDVQSGLEWLYLLHPGHGLVVVYEPTRHDHWLRHSLHHLDPVEDLFVTEPGHGEWGDLRVCTNCGAVDEIEYHEMPSMAGYGQDATTACTRCGSSVTTDPMFGAHTARKPWPPNTPTAGRTSSRI
jgi:hypothetical protein